MPGFNLSTKAEPTYQGRLGRIENTKRAGELRRKYLYPLLLRNNIQIKRVNGEEGHLIPRILHEYKGWNPVVSRMTSKQGSGGLLYRIYDALNYQNSEILCMAWLPILAEQKKNSYPRINVPSGINTVSELYDLCEVLSIYYLVLYIRQDGRPTRYSLGRYIDIPIEYWRGWNKYAYRRKTINAVNFPKHTFPSPVLGHEGINLATHIRRELGTK